MLQTTHYETSLETNNTKRQDESKEKDRKEKEISKVGEQYELQHFLEQENSRLTGLEVFLSKKVSLKTNFSQTEKLIQVQIERKKVLNEKLVKELRQLDSLFQSNLAQFFNSHFS